MGQSEKSEPGKKSEIIKLEPIGVVKNQSQEASWDIRYQALTWQERAARMKEQSQSMSELIMNPDLEEMLDGIEKFSHLMVLYWSHLVPEEKRWVKKVHPLGSPDFPLVGTFATHSPARPNSILVTVVRLLERKENVLRVTGLDALDDSPILDIKPYLPDQCDSKDIRMPEWMKKMRARFEQDRE
jgi:tRNA-Thr(GGU) m(6)t(6)A37 methyltransferase TsaA